MAKFGTTKVCQIMPRYLKVRGHFPTPLVWPLRAQVACIGNHDFDHGLEPLAGLLESCDFPWLLSNVFDADTGLPLGGAMETHVLDWQGRRIGLMGLVEPDWMATLAAIEEDAIKYVDFVEQVCRAPAPACPTGGAGRSRTEGVWPGVRIVPLISKPHVEACVQRMPCPTNTSVRTVFFCGPH